jgi:hypothetical protein
MKEIALRLDGINEVPRILVDGREVKNICAVDLNWNSSGFNSHGKCFMKIEFIEDDAVKSISIDRLGSPLKGGDGNGKDKGNTDI